MCTDHADTPAGCKYATVYVVFELSKAKWQLGIMLPGTEKMSRYRIDGGDLAALAALLVKARSKAEQTGKLVRILSCYEAGLDGHWLHRWLADNEVLNHEIDASSIEVNRRARRAKTDRIDLAQLMRSFLAYLRGEPRVCSMVRVPTPEDEDRKRRTRERERLLQERTGHSNRIKGLLHGQGIRDVMPLKPGFLASLDAMRTGDGRVLPPRLKDEIRREHERLVLVHKQIKGLEAANAAAHRTPAKDSAEAKAVQLAQLKAIGPHIAQLLANEVFYRDFKNRRQLGSCVGLTDVPYDSGARRRQQGISKAGNRRARTTAIELAWLWLRHQPDTELSRWFRERVGNLKGRIRKMRHRGAGAQADGGPLALSGDRPRAEWRRHASELLSNAGAPMTTDVTQDRRVTEPGLGSSDSAFVDGSRLFWALPSPVHERSGFGPPHPTGYKLMRCWPHNDVTAQSRTSRQAVNRAPRNVPIRKLCSGLATVKAAPRRLRRWPAANLDGGCVRRSGYPSGSKGASPSTEHAKGKAMP
ncbi:MULTISPECIES: IS110 family transposase [unclassified Bradyrhizobium]|uniref:IS110 family transposase n=1 Tax=unclassified Bradyrhizobium TaxID=2631580 RepID=UPI002FF0037D